MLSSASASGSSLNGTDGGSGSGLLWPTGPSQFTQNLVDNWGPAFGVSAQGTEFYFKQCLAVFFPCFTGILSGANRGASLRDPSTAVPHGTLTAICFSYVMCAPFPPHRLVSCPSVNAPKARLLTTCLR